MPDAGTTTRKRKMILKRQALKKFNRGSEWYSPFILYAVLGTVFEREVTINGGYE